MRNDILIYENGEGCYFVIEIFSMQLCLSFNIGIQLLKKIETFFSIMKLK